MQGLLNKFCMLPRFIIIIVIINDNIIINDYCYYYLQPRSCN